MTDHTPDELQAIGKAKQAKAELSQTDKAFEDVRAQLLELIATSKPGETVLREKAYLGVQVLENVKGWLIKAAAGADVAEFTAEMREAMGDRGIV
ncbi:MAG: hypothetical protein A3E78_09515 [Alphaproteobacteria bacterium RIFCSPHIGHO2_12_FULL_63_12]|nr:MAG: hypothetical protein A3E78_09515 [Alphaproteobacteria bacterium RIFCSPHIGHO2_12_FULL_63_12]